MKCVQDTSAQCFAGTGISAALTGKGQASRLIIGTTMMSIHTEEAWYKSQDFKCGLVQNQPLNPSTPWIHCNFPAVSSHFSHIFPCKSHHFQRAWRAGRPAAAPALSPHEVGPTAPNSSNPLVHDIGITQKWSRNGKDSRKIVQIGSIAVQFSPPVHPAEAVFQLPSGTPFHVNTLVPPCVSPHSIIFSLPPASPYQQDPGLEAKEMILPARSVPAAARSQQWPLQIGLRLFHYTFLSTIFQPFSPANSKYQRHLQENARNTTGLGVASFQCFT